MGAHSSPVPAARAWGYVGVYSVVYALALLAASLLTGEKLAEVNFACPLHAGRLAPLHLPPTPPRHARPQRTNARTPPPPPHARRWPPPPHRCPPRGGTRPGEGESRRAHSGNSGPAGAEEVVLYEQGPPHTRPHTTWHARRARHQACGSSDGRRVPLAHPSRHAEHPAARWFFDGGASPPLSCCLHPCLTHSVHARRMEPRMHAVRTIPSASARV